MHINKIVLHVYKYSFICRIHVSLSFFNINGIILCTLFCDAEIQTGWSTAS